MRGFTLYETLVTLALAGLVLAISGQILSDYGRVTKQARMHADGQELASQGLRVLARQLRLATSWVAPASGSDSQVSWTYWSSTPEQWLTLGGDGSWSPQGQTATARAWLQDGRLRCQGATDVVLGERIDSFRARRIASDMLELTADVSDGAHSLTVTSMAVRMVAP